MPAYSISILNVRFTTDGANCGLRPEGGCFQHSVVWKAEVKMSRHKEVWGSGGIAPTFVITTAKRAPTQSIRLEIEPSAQNKKIIH
jgi:hypothetical protein